MKLSILVAAFLAKFTGESNVAKITRKEREIELVTNAAVDRINAAVKDELGAITHSVHAGIGRIQALVGTGSASITSASPSLQRALNKLDEAASEVALLAASR